MNGKSFLQINNDDNELYTQVQDLVNYRKAGMDPA